MGFKEALAGCQPWLEGTDLIVISNTQWVGENVPCLTYGMRGMISLSVEVGGRLGCLLENSLARCALILGCRGLTAPGCC